MDIKEISKQAINSINYSQCLSLHNCVTSLKNNDPEKAYENLKVFTKLQEIKESL